MKNIELHGDMKLTTVQLRALVKLRRLYADYPGGLGTKDVMKMLGVGRATVLNLKNSGMLRCLKIGNRLIFPKDWVLEYLAVYAYRERPNITAYQREVLRFCRTRRTITEIAEYMNLGAGFCRDYLLAPLCEQGRLRCEVDKAEVKRHCYVAVR